MILYIIERENIKYQLSDDGNYIYRIPTAIDKPVKIVTENQTIKIEKEYKNNLLKKIK